MSFELYYDIFLMHKHYFENVLKYYPFRQPFDMLKLKTDSANQKPVLL